MEKLPPGKPSGQDIADQIGGGLLTWVMGLVGGAIAGILGGFASVIDAIFGTVNNTYVAELPIISNHTYQLSEIRETVESQILQGLAVTFTASGWWYPPATLVYADLIGIGGGGSGGGGQWSLTVNRNGGGGGGGGGEIHFRIYAAFLPKTNGVFDPIRVDLYLTGPPGSGGGSPTAGLGGGNIVFGANLPQPIVTFQGGSGGMSGAAGAPAPGGAGGFGMIPGGKGGDGGNNGSLEGVWPGGVSASAFTFSGGGGGGGGGGADGNVSTAVAGPGGNGVAAAGGTSGGGGQAPSPVIAVGGGGGGGAMGWGVAGGIGGFPGGGGGGGYGGTSNSSGGGKGAEPKLWIVETKNSA
ncbi:hypothetical protein [Rhodococcus erythropolis]